VSALDWLANHKRTNLHRGVIGTGNLLATHAGAVAHLETRA
jgi:hypothetical protein